MPIASLRALALLLAAVPFAALAKAPVVDPYGSQPQIQPAGGAQQAALSPQGELFMQLQQLSSEVARLRGLVEEQQYQIEQLRQEGQQRYQDLDGRIEGLRSQPAPAPVASSEPDAGPDAGSDIGDSAAAGDPDKEKLLYDACFDLIKARDFEKADLAFNAFLRKYPQSQYTSNAHYWIGEIKLAQGDLQAAGDAFSTVIGLFPQSPKVPDALYKLAEVERRQGRPVEARELLQQVVSQHPDSSAATLAKGELARQ